ncbi:hypothetical protein OUZ56_012462 [Daphnia magna]|uniref:Uncharacterized protein n=1 Tax=Daphnia magna TaxID=35525 RepID=A0ABQ9Z327_9CRUS|nr:hypothetical protein OUZ56_012462 [Daphnia magna]
MTAMAVEEAQVRSRLNPFQAKYVEPNRELTKVKEALDRLSTQVESNTNQTHLEENMEKIQRQLSTRRNTPGKLLPPDKNLKPSPPEGYDGNGKKLTSFDEKGKLKTTEVKEGKELINFTKEVDVDLFSINDRRFVTEGTITVNFFVAEETIRQSIYRVPEIDHFQETENPFVIRKSLRIPPNSSSLLENREEETHPFNPLNTCHFVRCCNIPSGLSLEPYISTTPNRSLRVVAVKGTDKTIFLPRLTVLGTLLFSRPSRKPVETMASISVASSPINTAAVKSALPDIDEENKENLRR